MKWDICTFILIRKGRSHIPNWMKMQINFCEHIHHTSVVYHEASTSMQYCHETISKALITRCSLLLPPYSHTIYSVPWILLLNWWSCFWGTFCNDATSIKCDSKFPMSLLPLNRPQLYKVLGMWLCSDILWWLNNYLRYGTQWLYLILQTPARGSKMVGEKPNCERVKNILKVHDTNVQSI